LSGGAASWQAGAEGKEELRICWRWGTVISNRILRADIEGA